MQKIEETKGRAKMSYPLAKVDSKLYQKMNYFKSLKKQANDIDGRRRSSSLLFNFGYNIEKIFDMVDYLNYHMRKVLVNEEEEKPKQQLQVPQKSRRRFTELSVIEEVLSPSSNDDLRTLKPKPVPSTFSNYFNQQSQVVNGPKIYPNKGIHCQKLRSISPFAATSLSNVSANANNTNINLFKEFKAYELYAKLSCCLKSIGAMRNKVKNMNSLLNTFNHESKTQINFNIINNIIKAP